MATELASLLTIADLERVARTRLEASAYDYYRTGSDALATLIENRRAFSRWLLLPRVLVDVSRIDLRAKVLGAELALPIVVAPTAYHRLATPEGELDSARAAAAAGSLLVVSTLSTTPLEDVARAAPGPKWFQLYVHKDRGKTRALVSRAEAAGYLAICLTVDAPVLGRRLADARNRFRLPPDMGLANFPELAEEAGSRSIAAHFAESIDASLSWRDVEELRKSTRLPLVLKGIVRGDDAARAVDSGAAGIVVSNHGGRQLDGEIATLDALPEVVDAVAGRIEVTVDGGVRSGTDVLKALALGARAVLVGRPFLWGLAAGGRAGGEKALGILREELERAMALAGCPELAAVTRDLVRARS